MTFTSQRILSLLKCSRITDWITIIASKQFAACVCCTILSFVLISVVVLSSFVSTSQSARLLAKASVISASSTLLYSHCFCNYWCGNKLNSHSNLSKHSCHFVGRMMGWCQVVLFSLVSCNNFHSWYKSSCDNQMSIYIWFTILQTTVLQIWYCLWHYMVFVKKLHESTDFMNIMPRNKPDPLGRGIHCNLTPTNADS